MDMEILRVRGKNFVVSCTHALMSVARCIYYGNCFVGKYFVVYFSTTKTTKILTPEKYPLYGIILLDKSAVCKADAASLGLEAALMARAGSTM